MAERGGADGEGLDMEGPDREGLNLEGPKRGGGGGGEQEGLNTLIELVS